MKTHYYVILARPQGSHTWTPLTIHPIHNVAGNFFASAENAKQWVDHEMPESMQTVFLHGPKKRVLREFKIGRVVSDDNFVNTSEEANRNRERDGTVVEGERIRAAGVRALPTKPGPYYWREKGGDEWEHIFVMDPGNGHLYGHELRTDGVVATSLHDWEQDYGAVGEWLPIPTADDLADLQAAKKMVDDGQEAEMVFDHHSRVRHLGSITDYAKLVGSTVTHLRRNGYTCQPVKIIRNAKR